jgi:prepilin-type N-terminal cleavage/methylation domain-containing protein
MLLAFRKNRQRGLTLLELMVVLALLAGLCAMILPDLLNTHLPRYRLNNAAQRLVNDILYARMRAVSTNRQHRIVFDTKCNAYWIEAGDRSRDSKTWSLEATARRLGDPRSDACFPGVELVAATKTTLMFKPTGGQTPMSVTIRHSSGQIIKIYMAIAGRIRMERGV